MLIKPKQKILIGVKRKMVEENGYTIPNYTAEVVDKAESGKLVFEFQSLTNVQFAELMEVFSTLESDLIGKMDDAKKHFASLIVKVHNLPEGADLSTIDFLLIAPVMYKLVESCTLSLEDSLFLE